MPQFTRTWWGKRFIEALEDFTDPGRLSRGRSYASGGKVKSFAIKGGAVAAKVRGSINPYFGVYEEPLYTTQIEVKQISAADWRKAIVQLSTKASFVAKLLMNEIPDNIEDVFAGLKLHLLPHNRSDFQTSCSCPDWGNPCKHIAGVYYLVAAELDRDPFLLFELRGLPKQDLLAELARSPLGQALSAELTAELPTPAPVTAYCTPPQAVSLQTVPSLREFWQGQKRLPQTVEVAAVTAVPAVLVKKQGDFPAFWQKDGSFIAAMEELYERVKTKNRELL
jgi:uncharacterized Zn finger protein